jgi:hypothetical protein
MLCSRSYGSWICNYLCNQCLSPLTLWVRILLRRCVLNTTLCDKVCQGLSTDQWFSPGTQVSSTNKTDCQDITEIWLKVALNTITHSSIYYIFHKSRWILPFLIHFYQVLSKLLFWYFFCKMNVCISYLHEYDVKMS